MESKKTELIATENKLWMPQVGVGDMGEMGEGSQEAQISSYKINKFFGEKNLTTKRTSYDDYI